MKIALFGGAFDPPHLGHKQVADSLLKDGIVDEVWFVPVFTHPWAKRIGKDFLTPYEKRVEMLELMLKDASCKEEYSGDHNNYCENNDDKYFSKKQRVAHFKGVSFTFDTLEYFSKKYPEREFSWVMGSEYLPKFEDFLEGHPGLMDYHFYIYPREGGIFEPMYENMTALKGMEEVGISSSMVRERVKDEGSISGFVVSGVEEYVMEYSLYKSEK